MNNWANGQFEFLDLLLAPLYILIIVVLFYAFSPEEKSLKKYYLRGLFYKILGGIIFGLFIVGYIMGVILGLIFIVLKQLVIY